MNVDPSYAMNLIVFSFLAMPPILPLTDEDIKRFAKGIPRDKMNSFMHRFPISQRTKLWKHLKWIAKFGASSLRAILLAHRANAERIVNDIWAKWNFDRNVTLPPKTIRTLWEHNRFLDKSTGRSYIKD